MSDLKALLGDRYDDVIEKAASAVDAAWNPERYPVLAAMFSDYAHTALAAVLPVLLADARREGQADAWDEGVGIALDHAIRNPDGITLRLEHLDGRPWANPYRSTEPAEETR